MAYVTGEDDLKHGGTKLGRDHAHATTCNNY